MLHPLEHICDHQNPLADTPALASCQPPQLGRPRFAAKEVSRHRPSPKHGTLAYQLYHIWGSLEPGITCSRPEPALLLGEPVYQHVDERAYLGGQMPAMGIERIDFALLR